MLTEGKVMYKKVLKRILGLDTVILNCIAVCEAVGYFL